MRFATIADKAEIERICNHPEIRVWTACDGAPPCDALKYITAPSFTVLDERGCFLANFLDPRRYVIHTNLLPECRGIDAINAATEFLCLTFLRTDAVELLTMVPANIPQAKSVARRMGFRHLFDRHAVWPVLGTRQDMGFYSLSLSDWIATGVWREAGKQFHERLHDEGHDSHPHDPVHDAFVGAAVEMVRDGHPVKAVETYNRWARFALYEPIAIVSTDPLRIDIGSCVLRIEGGQFFTEAQHA